MATMTELPWHDHAFHHHSRDGSILVLYFKERQDLDNFRHQLPGIRDSMTLDRHRTQDVFNRSATAPLDSSQSFYSASNSLFQDDNPFESNESAIPTPPYSQSFNLSPSGQSSRECPWTDIAYTRSFDHSKRKKEEAKQSGRKEGEVGGRLEDVTHVTRAALLAIADFIFESFPKVVVQGSPPASPGGGEVVEGVGTKVDKGGLVGQISDMMPRVIRRGRNRYECALVFGSTTEFHTSDTGIVEEGYRSEGDEAWC